MNPFIKTAISETKVNSTKDDKFLSSMQSMLYISYSSFEYDVFVDQPMYSRPRQVYWSHKLKDITVNKKKKWLYNYLVCDKKDLILISCKC